jgi:type III secretion protein J
MRRAPGNAAGLHPLVGLAGLCLSVVVVGCAVPVASGLDEGDANRIVVTLDHASIEAIKEADPVVEGKFRVTVTRDDASRALVAMRSEDLPRPHTTGVLDALDKSALVPSPGQEHAQIVAGLAGDLGRTLEGIDGVLSARVHLNIAAPEPLRLAPVPKTTASVLVEHRGATPPLTEGAIQRLVAGGIPNLALADVAVVFVSRVPTPTPGADLRHVGPITVTRGSMRLLQLALAGLVVVVGGLGAVVLVLLARVRRFNEAREAGPEALSAPGDLRTRS